MNSVNIVGRITHDPEIRTTSTGKTTCSFSVAVNRSFTRDDGPTADFFKVVAWGQTAEFVGKYLAKGRLVSAMGRMENRSYEKDGQKVYIWELIAERVNALDKKPEGESGAQHEGPNKSASTPVASDNADYDPFSDE